MVTCTIAMEMPKLQQVTEGYKSKCKYVCIKRTRKNNESKGALSIGYNGYMYICNGNALGLQELM